MGEITFSNRFVKVRGIILRVFGIYKTTIELLGLFVYACSVIVIFNLVIKKANAFYQLGRSYIEKKKYDIALKYLILTDVKRYYPKESRFWREYTMVRVE